MRLKDKVAIVTGSSKGIGEGIARVFSKEGAKVVIVSRHPEEGIPVAKELGSDNGRAIYVQTDVADPKSIKNMINETVKAFGKLDIIVNNAGKNNPKSIEETSEEEWKFTMDTNLRSTFLCCQYALPHLKATKGNILIISSISAITGAFRQFAYGASKGGQIALSKNMATDLAPYGIRVNCLCPGVTQTQDMEDWFEAQGGKDVLLPMILAMTPLARLGTPEDIGKAALFLASDDASFVTGVTLCVDGGITKH